MSWRGYLEEGVDVGRGAAVSRLGGSRVRPAALGETVVIRRLHAVTVCESQREFVRAASKSAGYRQKALKSAGLRQSGT